MSLSSDLFIQFNVISLLFRFRKKKLRLLSATEWVKKRKKSKRNAIKKEIGKY